MYETCILCRKGAQAGERYYIRTDVKAMVTDLLRKIPRSLAYLFDFLPSTSITSSVIRWPFCCRSCKKLLEKRQKLVDNISVVESEMRCKRNGAHDSTGAARSLNFEEESLPLEWAKNQQLPTASSPAVPCTSRTPLVCDLSPIAVRPTTSTSLETISQSLVEDSRSVKRHKPELGVKVSNLHSLC